MRSEVFRLGGGQSDKTLTVQGRRVAAIGRHKTPQNRERDDQSGGRLQGLVAVDGGSCLWQHRGNPKHERVPRPRLVVAFGAFDGKEAKLTGNNTLGECRSSKSVQ